MHDNSRARLGDSDFSPSTTPGTGPHAFDDRISELLAVLIDAPEPTPEVAARKPVATGNGDLAAIVRLQATELERLAHENERLMDRLETLIRLQENEHKLRQELQEQVQRLGERPAAPTPAYDLDMVRREVRESTIEEIKPVLAAILDLFERSLDRSSEKPAATPPQAARGLQQMETFLRLPDILTRPLEELATREEGPPARRPGVVDPSESFATAAATSATRVGQFRRQGPGEERHSELPSVFAWTSLFS